MEDVSLKEHIEKILDEKDKALHAALVSLNERLTLLNELRGGVATKEEVKALSKEISELKASRDKIEGKGIGAREMIGWIIAVITIIGFIISNSKK